MTRAPMSTKPNVKKTMAFILSRVRVFEPRHEISNNVVLSASKGSDQPAHTGSLIRTSASRLNILSVKLITEYHLEFLSWKGGCKGSSKSTLVKMPHCCKSHVTAHLSLVWEPQHYDISVAYTQDAPIQTHTDISCRLMVFILVWIFISIQTLCIRAAKALASLRICADSPQPSLLRPSLHFSIMR